MEECCCMQCPKLHALPAVPSPAHSCMLCLLSSPRPTTACTVCPNPSSHRTLQRWTSRSYPPPASWCKGGSEAQTPRQAPPCSVGRRGGGGGMRVCKGGWRRSGDSTTACCLRSASNAWRELSLPSTRLKHPHTHSPSIAGWEKATQALTALVAPPS